MLTGVRLVSLPKAQHSPAPEFIQGSSLDHEPNDPAHSQELDSLAEWLHQSASFDESSSNSVWTKGGDTEQFTF